MQDYQISTSTPVVDPMDFLVIPRVTSSPVDYIYTGQMVDSPVVSVSPGLAVRLRPYPPSCHRRQ
jgi:hypothetical protein